jgi:amino acid adenylation domain-containing protein
LTFSYCYKSILSLPKFMSHYSSKLTDTHTTLVDLLRYRAINQSEKVGYRFLLDGENVGGYLSYGELDRQASVIASELDSLGVRGERALLLYPPGLEFIAAFFGCLYAGVIAVPLYPPLGNRYQNRIQGILADAMATVALTTQLIFSEIERRFAQIPELKALHWLLTDQVSNHQTLEWQPRAIGSNTLAYLQYTSGSTSTPKGVMISHDNVLHNSKCIQQAFELTPDSLSVSWLPHFHDMGLIDGIIQPLYTGYPGILMPPVSFLQQPMRWLQAISRYRATHCGGPNFAYELCVDKITPEKRSTLDLRCWRSAYNGAESVRKLTIERFTEAFKSCGFQASSFYPCYGLAEATLMVSGGLVKDEPVYTQVQADSLEKNQIVEVTHPGEKVIDLVGCGRSVSDTKIVIANPQSQTRCPSNEVGEIWVSSLSVAQGYWNRPDQTEKTYKAYLKDTSDGPFLCTGDLGFLRDGELFVTGRIKDMVIIRGRNHYPQDIELTVENSHSALRAGCGAAFAVLTEGVERLVIVHEVERSYLRQLDVEAVVRAIRSAVAQQHDLFVYAVVLLRTGKLPKTSSGKIQRQICRRNFQAGLLDEVGRRVVENWDELSGEVGLTREELLAIEPSERIHRLVDYLHSSVCLVLKVPKSQVDKQQPLSQLGLDSLMVIELKHLLETDLGVILSVGDFLLGKSLTQLGQQVLGLLNNSSAQISAAVISTSEQLTEYPLSHNQHALWLLHQLAPDSAAYNIFFAVRILSNLDVVAFKQVFQILSQRHPALRTTFTTINGQPVQRIHEHLEVTFEVTDASVWTQDELNERLVESAHHMFDLEHEPLMRVSLFRRGSQEDILLFTVHHIISDFWSLEILIDEFICLYKKKKFDTGNSLPPIKWQYADYVVWQKNMLAGSEGERLWYYWQKQLVGELPVLNLPTDRPRQRVQTYRGATHTFKLDQELTQLLKGVAQAEEATLYMVLLATLFVLLYRYTGVEDILVGSPAAGRSKPVLASVVGYFVTTVVLRSNLSGNPKFKEFLAQVRQTVLGALEHQDYPFPLLVERLNPERDPSYSPLFQVMFAFHKPSDLPELSALASGEAGTQINLGELQLESLGLETHVAQFDLTLMIVELDDRLTARWQYNTDLFEPATISRMAEHFLSLLQGIVTNLEQHLGELPLLTANEKQQLLVEWNNTQPDYPHNKCIHHLFEEQVEQNPSAVAAVFDNAQITYHDLNCRANQLAHHLQKLGVEPEVLVAVYLERSLEMLIALLAILKAGGAYMPLDPSLPQQRLAFMLADSTASVLLTHFHLVNTLPQHTASVVCLEQDWERISRHQRCNLKTQLQPQALAYIIYTSGSTGQPKGVAIEHCSVVNFLSAMQQQRMCKAEDTLLSVTTLSFDIAVLELFLPLVVGAKVVVVSREVATDSEQLLQQLSDSDATIMQATPATWQMLYAAVWQGSPQLTILCGGDALSWQLAQQLRQQNAEVWNLYGPTETTIWSIIHQVDDRKGEVPIGRPIRNTQIYLLDSNLQPVPIGVVGELYIGGDGLARGYLNRPELSAQKFIPNPHNKSQLKTQNSKASRLYKTGDLARYLADGNIEFIGRIDNQIKIRGNRVELEEIEAVVCQHPEVVQAVVIAREDTRADKRLVAYIVSNQQQVPSSNELRDFLKAQLPNYMIPSAFVILDALPLTPNGKINRCALPTPDTSEGSSVSVFVTPRNSTEELLAQLWAEVLGVKLVSIDDNFFDLGGHSLLIVNVHHKVKEIFNSNISLIDLFKYPTISALARYIIQQNHVQQPKFLPVNDLAKRQKEAIKRQKKRKQLIKQHKKANAQPNE